jgi:hypothetical protein
MNPSEEKNEGIVNFDPAECQLKQFKRNAYFSGKSMRAEDFVLEQKYTNEKRYLINRLILGTGIICGLEVKSVEKVCETWRVNLSPGCAIDCCGREIVVSKAIQCSVISTVQDNDCPKNIGLCLRRKDIPVDPVSNPICEPTAEQKCFESHIEEQYELVLCNLAEKDEGENGMSSRNFCKEALKTCPCCENVEEQGPKVLVAVLSCSQEGNLTINYTETYKHRDIIYSNFTLGSTLCDHQITNGSLSVKCEGKGKVKPEPPFYMISDTIPHKVKANNGLLPMIILGKTDNVTKKIQYLNDLPLPAGLKPCTPHDAEIRPEWLKPYLLGSSSTGSSKPVMFRVIELDVKEFKILTIWPVGCSEKDVEICWTAISVH